MIEFIGAFLGALCGVSLPIGIWLYNLNKSIKKDFKEFANSMITCGIVIMEVKHEI